MHNFRNRTVRVNDIVYNYGKISVVLVYWGKCILFLIKMLLKESYGLGPDHIPGKINTIMLVLKHVFPVIVTVEC